MKLIELKHLSIVEESYWQHLWWCLYSTYIFIIMIPLALIHGFFPFLLANVPDKVLARYLSNFKARRVRTGQEANNPIDV